MTQTIFQATPSGDRLSAEHMTSPLDVAIMRGDAGNDMIVGSAGNDRITGGAGNNWLYGGAGNDQFFTALSPRSTNVISGDEGNDSLYISLTASQLANPEVMAELRALNAFVTYAVPAKPDAVFGSATLGLVLQGVEHVSVRVDGRVLSLDAAGAQPLVHPVSFEDLVSTAGGFSGAFASVTVPAGYAGYDWSGSVEVTSYPAALYSWLGVGAGPDAGLRALTWEDVDAPLVVTKHGGGTFRFGGADVSTMDNNVAQTAFADVTFTGTLGGVVVGTVTIQASDVAWSNVRVNWGPIDTLTVSDNATGIPVGLDGLWLS
ncbi:hypothetical protein [Roseicella aquatilis]|uniref:Calcium-binding protein n=1 Tax=Roseicella aquatilis TaxID=2527868 RepID=A0A4R4DPS1_9PROT|nr:hypothetical protein [Roseicella aquatilis]TCZ62965.1 hypothetical protein EXY23_11325 [Roseicella aquatilis]